MWPALPKPIPSCVSPWACARPQDAAQSPSSSAAWTRKRWVASEAVTALLAYALHTLRLRRVVAQIDPHNLASVRVAEKAGMRYERDLLLEGYTH
ncbi:GNAT family N-acetyltransferase, partial [Calidithermus chliarophilus]|uniref:GNAT family N-acetyltransferase n=1 Tax=Calidithermus chliarophilus TaxID=52023 RepID=UPI003B833398